MTQSLTVVPVPSIVIAAHNEAGVLGRCLDALLAEQDSVPGGPDPLDITVVPNGCSDGTADIARSRGVRVVETDQASKAVALNLGDEVAVGFPRVYLDADMVLTGADVRGVCSRVSGPTLAAVPARRVDLTGSPWPVRAYFAINTRLPAFTQGLFGRGMIVLSAEGRARFDTFPLMVADDLFLDSLFAPHEKVHVDTVVSSVSAPRHTKDLVNRLVRVRRGNTQMRTASDTGDVPVAVRPADRLAWLRDVVRPQPWLAPAGIVYAVVTLVAARRARASAGSDVWQRDESTRHPERP